MMEGLNTTTSNLELSAKDTRSDLEKMSTKVQRIGVQISGLAVQVKDLEMYVLRFSVYSGVIH